VLKSVFRPFSKHLADKIEQADITHHFVMNVIRVSEDINFGVEKIT
jgi:hypothetical protein